MFYQKIQKHQLVELGNRLLPGNAKTVVSLIR